MIKRRGMYERSENSDNMLYQYLQDFTIIIFFMVEYKLLEEKLWLKIYA